MRPSKLTEEVLQECTRYLEDRLYEPGLPTTANLEDHLSVARRTIHNWSKNNADFDEFFDRLKTGQEQSLWNNELTRKWHSGMAQFALTNFGYTKPPSKIGQGIDRNNLAGEVTLRIKDKKNTIQIEDERKASYDGKYD